MTSDAKCAVFVLALPYQCSRSPEIMDNLILTSDTKCDPTTIEFSRVKTICSVLGRIILCWFSSCDTLSLDRTHSLCPGPSTQPIHFSDLISHSDKSSGASGPFVSRTNHNLWPVSTFTAVQNFPASKWTGDIAGTVATNAQFKLSQGKGLAVRIWDAAESRESFLCRC